MKSVKKYLVSTVATAIVTSILLTTASAESMLFNGFSAQLTTNSTTVLTAPVSNSVAQAPSVPAVVISDTVINNSESSSDDTSDMNSSTAPVAEAPVISDIKSSLINGSTIQDMQLSAGIAVANFTKQFNGYKYVYGSASPKSGFDCSGLVYYVYSQSGYSLPRTARSQYTQGSAVSKDELQPGDLVFFATKGGHSISHVGIYIGDHTFIHAATKRQGVIVSDLNSSYWTKTLVGAKRIITPESAVQVAFQ